MDQGMKSVMVFDPKDSEEETVRKWIEWNQHKSDVQMVNIFENESKGNR